MTVSVQRVAAWVLCAGVAGAWLASAAGVPRPRSDGKTPERAPAAHPVDHLAADVQSQAGRLRQRLETAPAPQTPLRNPFTFHVPPAPAAPRTRVVAASVQAAPQPVAPAEPLIDLIGIAEKKAGDSVVRTAVISDDSGDVIMATAGQKVVGVYEVVAVGHDVVELKHLATGMIRRLALR